MINTKILIPIYSNMADNWLENKFEEYYSGKTREQKAREAAWRRRMAAYKKKRDAEAAAARETASDTPKTSSNE